jgi:hypothetical protein
MAAFEYSGSMVRQVRGQMRTQLKHWMQEKLSMLQVSLSLLTVMACVGQRFSQMLHRIHSFMSQVTCPFVREVYTGATTGYILVAGFLNRLRNDILVR